MENIQQPNTVNDLNQNGLNKTIKLNTNQLGDIDTPNINNNKDNSYGPKKLPMLEDILISDPVYPEIKSENTRKNSVKKKNKGRSGGRKARRVQARGQRPREAGGQVNPILSYFSRNTGHPEKGVPCVFSCTAVIIPARCLQTRSSGSSPGRCRPPY